MAKQVTNIEVKKNNRNRVFRYILRGDQVSNPDIAYDLKISLPTVTQNTKELIERGLIREVGELQSTGGRRAKALAVVPDYRFAAGIDITQNHVAMILVNLVGETLKYERVHFPYRAKEAYFGEVSRKLEAFLEEAKVEKGRILGIGISFPGIVDLQREEIAYSHALGVRGLRFQNIERFFCYPCTFFNDANAGAYAEGIYRGTPDRFFYLSLSNTVGGAVFDHGQLMQGDSFRCGEVGHMTIVPDGAECYCGKKGCLDAYCTAKKLSDLAEGKLEHYFEALRNKEEDAVRLWDAYTMYLAVAVNNIHMVLDSDVVLGGYVGSYIEEFLPEIREKVSGRNTFDEDGTFVKACSHKEGSALGAALKVLDTFVETV